MGDGLLSKTKETCPEKGTWLGNGHDQFTVIDTPGFGDSDNDETFSKDYEHFQNMVQTLKDDTPSITVFLICIQGLERANTG